MTLGELLLDVKDDRSDIIEAISIMELRGIIINVGGFLRGKKSKSVTKNI